MNKDLELLIGGIDYHRLYSPKLTHSKETKELISKKVKEAYASGKILTDELSKKRSEHMKRIRKEGLITPWNKGKTNLPPDYYRSCMKAVITPIGKFDSIAAATKALRLRNGATIRERIKKGVEGYSWG